MEVKTAIECLQRMNPEDEIIIAWWVKEDFFDRPAWVAHQYDKPTGRMEACKKEWEDIVHIGDDMDWSPEIEILQEGLEEALEDLRKPKRCNQ